MSPLSNRFYCWSRQRSESTTPTVKQKMNHIKYLGSHMLRLETSCSKQLTNSVNTSVSEMKDKEGKRKTDRSLNTTLQKHAYTVNGVFQVQDSIFDGIADVIV